MDPRDGAAQKNGMVLTTIPLMRHLLTEHGQWQRQGDACSLVAGQLEDLTPLLGELETRSRDFHPSRERGMRACCITTRGSYTDLGLRAPAFPP